MLKLWGRANSSNVMKVIWLLEELKLPYERIDAGGPFGGTGTPEYRAMNPNGLVPTLQDDDFSLWESNAILRYICDRYAPGTPLRPTEPRARAEVNRWMDYQLAHLNTPQTTVFLGLVRTPPERRDMRAIAAAAQEAGRIWSVVDDALAHHAYVAGPHLTLADICYGPHVHRWWLLPIERAEVPHLRAWYDRLLANPSYARHVAIEMT